MDRRFRQTTKGSVAIVAALLVLALTTLRFFYLRRAEIVVDEFQHLHAAYLVAEGQTPFADFFEHHTPLFYYLAAPLLRRSSLDFDTILDARLLSLAASLASVAIGACWAWRLRGALAAAIVGVLLMANVFLFAHGTVLFLDVFASPFLLLSAMFLSMGRGRPLWIFASGLAMGIAILFTQKVVIAGFAPLAYLLLPLLGPGRSPADSRSRTWLRLFAFAAGGLAAACLLPLALGWTGFVAFLQEAVLMNLRWKARHFSFSDVAFLAATDGPIYVLALLGAVRSAASLWKRRFAWLPDDVPVLYLGALCLGCVLLPVVWREYFVSLVHFAVVVAGLYLWDLASGVFAARDSTADRRAVWSVAAAAGAATVDLVGRGVVSRHAMPAWMLLATAVLWFVAGGILVFWVRPRSAAGIAIVGVMLLVFPLAEQWSYFRESTNAFQRERVEFVLVHARPDQPVFDGYSGYGVFRPHAFQYWFLHDEVQLMLTAEELGPGVIKAIEKAKAPVIVVDQWSKALPAEVQRYFADAYEATSYPELRLRKGK